MNAKDFCGELRDKVLDVPNAELNAMKNAKIYSMQTAFNVSVYTILLVSL